MRLLFLTFCPDNRSSVVPPHLSSSDFSLTCVMDVVKQKHPLIPFHRAIFRCSICDWDNFRCHYWSSFLQILQRRTFRIASFISRSILFDIEVFLKSLTRRISKGRIFNVGIRLNMLTSQLTITIASIFIPVARLVQDISFARKYRNVALDNDKLCRVY